ncbi:MAG: hypothetical protein Q9191_007237 [Dirinaria sp. TL-2023a]
MAPQFQIGLELTNILNPLSQAVTTLGSLALVDAIKSAGSDALTELKLASLIGRHHIDNVIEFHFRAAVAKSEQSTISRYMDIILEAGAGPTVQQALKNPALFSMVVQLSLLGFAHKDESLAQSIVLAIEKLSELSGQAQQIVPEYVALLGTIRACQQQTASFSWASLFEGVEHKLQPIMADEEAYDLGLEQPRGSLKLKDMDLKDYWIRSLPFAILQALLTSLKELQAFPKSRLLKIKTISGISTIVVWCYHVLGLNVLVRKIGFETYFGDHVQTCNVVIELCEPQAVSATLMDPLDQFESVFKLSANENDPYIYPEIRYEAFGFGDRLLRKLYVDEVERRREIYIVIAYLLQYVSCVGSGMSTSTHRAGFFTHTELSADDILRAARFLFALEDVDEELLDDIKSSDPEQLVYLSKANWKALLATVVAFARIEPFDLERCQRIPLSRVAFYSLQDEFHKKPDKREIDDSRVL